MFALRIGQSAIIMSSHTSLHLLRKKQNTYSKLHQLYLLLALLYLLPSSLHELPLCHNISTSDMKCNTSVNICRLPLWAMLWGKTKFQGAETDSQHTADVWPPEPILAMKPFFSAYHQENRISKCTELFFFPLHFHSPFRVLRFVFVSKCLWCMKKRDVESDWSC